MAGFSALRPSPAFAVDDTFQALLRRAGASEARKSESCTFIEDSVVEQVSAEGKSEGKVYRRYEAIVKDAKITGRKLLSKNVEGSPSSFLQREPENNSDRQYSAFHPSQQSLYVFTQEESSDPAQAKVRFVPREKHQKRLQGTALVDRQTGLVVRMDAIPSELPSMVREFRLTLLQAETPCGPQATQVRMQGKGGILFFTLRFRGETTMTGHRAIP